MNTSPVDTTAHRILVDVRGTTSKFRADIQGLRALAVGLVLLYHAGFPGVTGGFIGVDVFFVISGFLITGLLVRELEATGRVSVPAFYGRRIRRILPAATVVLLVTVAATVLVLPRTRWSDTATQVMASATYVVNWLFAADAVDYLKADAAPSALQHYWSLAIEEQFYLLWPLVLVAIAMVARRRDAPVARSWIAMGALTVTVPSLAWSVMRTAEDPAAAYFVSTTRLWELGLGALVAIGAPALGRLPRAAAVVLGWVGLGAVIWAATTFSTATAFPGAAALAPTLGAALIIVAGIAGRSRRGVGALLSVRPVTWVGDLSYSLYLWHWPVLVFAAHRFGELGSAHRLALVIFAALPAYLSYRFVEKPFQHSTAIRSGGRTLLIGLVLTASTIGTGVGLQVAASSDVVTTASSSSEQGSGLPGIDARAESLTGAERDALRPSAVDAADDNPTVYEDGCHRRQSESDVKWCTYGDVDGETTVALVGDSHAANWVPALQVLALNEGWRLETATKSSCPFADADFVVGESAAPYPGCREWYETVLDDLVAAQPDLVVTSSIDYAPVVEGDETAGDDATRLLGEAYGRSWRTLVGYDIPVVAIVDTPAMGFNVPDCVAAHPQNFAACSAPRLTALEGHGQAQEHAARTTSNVAIVDMNDHLCGAQECSAVINGILVYRDTQHLTATYSRELSQALGRRIQASGLIFGH